MANAKTTAAAKAPATKVETKVAATKKEEAVKAPAKVAEPKKEEVKATTVKKAEKEAPKAEKKAPVKKAEAKVEKKTTVFVEFGNVKYDVTNIESKVAKAIGKKKATEVNVYINAEGKAYYTIDGKGGENLFVEL